MLPVASILSLIFGTLGLVVTKNNAQYVLSGYNTMSKQERQAVDIDSYLRFFKRFHLTLALSLLVCVWLLSLKNSNWASLFMTLYPLGAYVYFLFKGASFYKASTQQKVGTYLAGGVLIVAMALVLAGSFGNYKSSELVLRQKSLEITGANGFTLSKQEIYGQQVVDELPPIVYKANGFAAGDYAKGRFKVKNGQTVWLFVNKKVRPFVLIKTAKGNVYYNHDALKAGVLSQNLAQWLKTSQ